DNTIAGISNGTAGSGSGGGGQPTPVDYFADTPGAPQNRAIASTIAQVNTGGAVTVSGAAGTPGYRICGDATCSADPAFTSAAGTIASGQFLQLNLTTDA